MNKWTKTAGLLFLAAAAVCSDRAIAAKPAKTVSASDKSPATDVKLLDEVDPFAAPTTRPADTTAASSATDKGQGAAPVKVNEDGTFSLNITAGADVVEQLRVIGFQAQTSIIPSKDVHGALPAMDLYNVTVHEALNAMLHANGFAWRENGKFIYVYSAKEIAQIERESRTTATEVFRLYYTPAANAQNMIKPVLSEEGQVAVTTPAKSGIATGTSDVGGSEHATEDLIVVTDFPENLEKVRNVLKEIDRRPEQILIEATILRASLSEDNALGVDFNVVGGVDFSNITQGLAGIGPAFGSGSTTLNGNNANSVGTGNAFSSPVAGGLKVGVVTNNISMFLGALEGITDTTILANPKVLALNKQKGEVIVGREDGYLTTTVTESSSTQTVEFLKTGTRLIFRPFIANDGFIRMEVHPEDSSGGLQTAANLPFKITTEVTSNVMVKDGHTIVIGGLFRESSDSTRSQIPFLGNLPLAGPLFRNTRDSTRREEVIILLTPHIIRDEAAYSALSEEQLKDADKLRVGVRKGMMPWGRERMAEMYYEWAVNEMSKSKPNRSLALWHLDGATNLNPKFIEAINLKQELTGKQMTSIEASSIRGFVRKAIMTDKAPATQPTALLDDAPTTAPAVAGISDNANDALLDESYVFAAPATQPANQPMVAEATSNDVIKEESGAELADAFEFNVSPADAPTSQPAESAVATVENKEESNPSNESKESSRFVELPSEELPSAFDASK